MELEQYSGDQLKIYSVIPSATNLFEDFFIENEREYPIEIDDLDEKLVAIGSDTGLIGQWFRRDEGRFGDGVCALFDTPDKALRLYFILYGNATKDLAIVLGGGGPKEVRALQDDEKLMEENYFLRDVAASLQHYIDAGELKIDEEGFYLDNDAERADFIFEIIKK